jgi:hypothetical protein
LPGTGRIWVKGTVFITWKDFTPIDGVHGTSGEATRHYDTGGWYQLFCIPTYAESQIPRR